MTGKLRRPKPPRDLGAEAREWWRRHIEAFEWEPHEIPSVRLAAKMLDRSEKANEVIARKGATYTDRFGQPRARPEVGIARDSAIVFSRLVREMRLNTAAEEARPPGLTGGRRA